MRLWQNAWQAVMQIGTELVWQEGAGTAAWRQSSRVDGPWFGQVCVWLEAYAGKPLFQPSESLREEQLALAGQMREELAVICAEMEPVEAMALLCGLPGSRELGYAGDRLAAALQVTAADVQAWERQAYARMAELLLEQARRLVPHGQVVSEQGSDASDRSSAHDLTRAERVPLLAFLALQIEPLVLEEQTESADAKKEQETALVEQARMLPSFDLRRYVTAEKELAIRQLLHRNGLTEREQVRSHFSEEEAWLVDLVAERMMMETAGKEDGADADSDA